MSNETEYNFEIWDDWEIAELEKMGEYFAAGFLEGKDKSIVMRTGTAIKRHLTNVILPTYEGTRLYPSKNVSFWWGSILSFCYFSYFQVDRAKLEEKCNKADGDQLIVLEKYKRFLTTYPLFSVETGYNHSSVNYGRFLHEGLLGYKKRIDNAYLNKINSSEKIDFLKSMNIVFEGISTLVNRIISYVKNVQFNDLQKQKNQTTILKTFEMLLSGTLQSFGSAMVATNFLFYLDGCDGIGLFDRFMEKYYLMSKDCGEITQDIELEWIKELWDNIDKTNGYNITLGGSKAGGDKAYNELTILALKASKGRRRPNVVLRIRKDAPDEVWNVALDSISSSSSIPALYSEENYIKALEEARLNIVNGDIYDYAFGGCTETLIHGCSNVGSTDIFVNVLHH